MPKERLIADIKSKLLHPALTSHFEVEIPIPVGKFGDFLTKNGLPGFAGINQETLNLMCCEATLPGSNLATFEINDNFHGVTERHAYRRVYDDRIDLTFYVDADNYIPIRFFETWMKYIVSESMTPQPERGNVGSSGNNYFYRVKYPDGPDGYAAQQGLKVIKFERTGNVTGSVTPTEYKVQGSKYSSPTLEYRFVRAFPISINSMPVSYDSSSLLKCTVSMSYIRYTLVQGERETAPDPASTTTPASNPAQQAAANSQAITRQSLTAAGIPASKAAQVTDPNRSLLAQLNDGG